MKCVIKASGFLKGVLPVFATNWLVAILKNRRTFKL